MIEKSELNRGGRLGTEVTGRVDERRAGEMHPDPVDPNPCGEGGTIISEPVGEFQTARSILEVFVFGPKEAEEGSGDMLSLGPGIPSFMNAGSEWLVFFLQDHRARESVGGRGPEFFELADQSLEFLSLDLIQAPVDRTGQVEIKRIFRLFVFRSDFGNMLVHRKGFFEESGAVGLGFGSG